MYIRCINNIYKTYISKISKCKIRIGKRTGSWEAAKAQPICDLDSDIQQIPGKRTLTTSKQDLWK